MQMFELTKLHVSTHCPHNLANPLKAELDEKTKRLRWATALASELKIGFKTREVL